MPRWAKRITVVVGLLALANGLLFATVPEIRQEGRRLWRAWTRPLTRAGFSVQSIIDAAGNEKKYSLFIPHQPPPPDGYPLILYLNGLGENGDDGIAPLYNALAPVVWERQHEFPFAVIFAQCSKGDSWTSGGNAVAQAYAIVSELQEKCRIDADRLYLTGISAGGAGTWVLASAEPERFAAIVPVSSGGAGTDSLSAISRAGLPVWSFYVRGDGADVVDGNRAARAALVAAGASPHFTEIDGSQDQHGSLHNAWDRTYRTSILYDWLLRQRRSANGRNAAPFQRLFDSRDSANIAMSDADVWTIENGEVRCAGERPEDARLATELESAEFEMHCEFQQDDNGGWSIEWRPAGGEETSGFVFRMRSPERGHCELRQKSGNRWLTDGDPVAERSFRAGEWNDFRLRVSKGRVSAELNGWPLLSVPVEVSTGTATSLSIVAPRECRAAVSWRDVRCRSLPLLGEDARAR